MRFVWGWCDEQFMEPLPEESAEGCRIECRILHIPRPDQTFFCPECEHRILN